MMDRTLLSTVLIACLLLSGCMSGRQVDDVGDVDILEDTPSEKTVKDDPIEDVAVDAGMDKAGDGLVDLGSLDDAGVDDPIDGLSKDVGIEEADSDLIELGELI
ncbi:hypothetical protein ACFLRF_01105 [Candidatus Altiarchaeota archaeon]